jgi:hypothetical protein
MYARSQFNDQIKNGHCLAIGVHGLHGVHVIVTAGDFEP